MITILLMVISYVLGSVPNALWIGKVFKGIDIREHGSRNTGSTNATRVLGAKLGVIVLVMDILKGFIPEYYQVQSREPQLLLFHALPCLQKRQNKYPYSVSIPYRKAPMDC